MSLALLEACPPTVVTHCLAAALTADSRGVQHDLVVARATALEVYTLREERSPLSARPSSKNSQHLDGVASAQLRFVTRMPLNGTVAALSVVSTPGAPRDRLLVAFADAKVAMVDFDAEEHCLRTIAVHTFEALEDFVGCIETGFPPVLRAHPGGTCAALLVYGTQLLLMPLVGAAAFGSGAALPGVPPLAATPSTAEINAAAALGLPVAGSSQIATAVTVAKESDAPGCSRVELPSLNLKHVRDLAFIEGYSEPVLGVLCEPMQTWSGRLAFLTNTCTLAALQLSSRRPTCQPLWEVKGLPHDTSSVLPLPAPTGGLLALSDNALLWLSPSHKYGLALNRDANCACVPQLAACNPAIRITLRGACAALLSTRPLSVALSLASGELYIARLTADGRGVQGIDLVKVVVSVPACTACTLASRYLFLGSQVADSLLLQLYDPLTARRPTPVAIAATATAMTSTSIRDTDLFAPKKPQAGSLPLASAAGASTDATEAEAGDDEPGAKRVKIEIDESGDGPAEANGGDALMVTDGGDGGDAELAIDMEAEAAAWEQAAEAREAAELLEEAQLYAARAPGLSTAPSPRRAGGRVQVRLRDSFISVAPIADLSALPKEGKDAPSSGGGWVGGMQAVLCGGRGKSGCLARLSRGVQLASLAAFDLPACEAVFTLPSKAQDAPEGVATRPFHRYVLLSVAGGSRVLEVGDELSEVTQSAGVHTAGPTLLFAPLRSATLAVQVHAQGVVLLRGIARLAETAPPEGRAIARASSTDTNVLCILDDGSPWLLQLSSDLDRLVATSVHEQTSSAKPKPARFLTASLYVDTRGVFTAASVTPLATAAAAPSTPRLVAPSTAFTASPAKGAVLSRTDTIRSERRGAAGVDEQSALEDAMLYARTREPAASNTMPTTGNGGGGDSSPRPPAAGAGPAATLCVSMDVRGRVCVWRLSERPPPAAVPDEFWDEDAPPIIAWQLLFASSTALARGAELAYNEAVEDTVGPEGGAMSPQALTALAEGYAEVRLLSMASSSSPVLVLVLAPARTTTQPPPPPKLLLYRPFVAGSTGCRVRFRRAPHPPSLPCDPAAYEGDDGGDDTVGGDDGEGGEGGEGAPMEATLQLASRPLRVVSLGSLGGEGTPLDGAVLVLGTTPATLLCVMRDRVWAHRLFPPADAQDAPMACAAALHVPNCPHGALVMTPRGRLLISRLQPAPANAQPTRYDCPWPLTKMTLRATGHAIAVMHESKALAVAVSTADLLPDSSLPASELDAELGPVASLHGAARYADQYEIRLLDLESWDVLDAFELKEHEWVVAMKPMRLRHEFSPPPLPANASGMNAYAYRQAAAKPKPPEMANVLAIGTGTVLGEDRSCTGRVLLLRVTEKPKEDEAAKADADADGAAEEGEGGAPKDKAGDGDDVKAKTEEGPPAAAPAAEPADDGGDKRRFELAVDCEERGPVLSVGCLTKHGYLLAGVGPKLVTSVYRDDALVALGFYIAGFGVSALSTLQNYVLAGDVHAGIQLLQWRPERQSLTLVSKHVESRSAYCCEFMLHEGALHLLLCEEGPTVRTLNYARQEANTQRGTLLHPRAAFHVAGAITRMVRLVLPPSGPPAPPAPPPAAWGAPPQPPQQPKKQRTALLWASADGSIGYIAPLEEAAFRRLAFLSQKMVLGLPHGCGLHPRAFRAKGVAATSSKELKAMVDASLLARYVHLGEEEQQRLALMVGSTPKKVMAALAALGQGLP